MPKRPSIRFILSTCLCLALTSCTAAPIKAPLAIGPGAAVGPPPVGRILITPRPASFGRQDTTHIVGPYETLWRISKMYDVPPREIMLANGIHSPSALTMGQRLLIPHAAPLEHVLHLFPSAKWRYIIIHHSATDAGSALQFNAAHMAKGWDRGVGYDFVIDRASSGRQDGEIEESPRWLKQEDGAHCKASDMNKKAIGICLVGNFNVEQVTPKQMESLVFLVRTLQDYYHISVSHIIRHGHVPGAKTLCPGTRFPWEEFMSRLSNR